MDGVEVEVRATIDRAWLEGMLESDPVSHAYALWDLLHFPERVRFVSAMRGGTTVGYLLVWLGRPSRPIVHWFGRLPDAAELVRSFPAPPHVAVVPEEVRPLIESAGAAATASSILLLLRPRGAPAVPPSRGDVRRLRREDRDALAAWAARESDAVLTEYATSDPETERLWGAFDDGRLVAIAAASVRLPKIWIVAGVYTDPAARRRGFGRAVVSAVIESAERAGATVGLYARETGTAALGMYGRLGFRPVGHRWWLERTVPPEGG